MADPRNPLQYESPRPINRQYSKGLALMLCAPGAASFTLFFSGVLGAFPIGLSGQGMDMVFWPLWWFAVLTAITSVCLYVRFPLSAMPWYVILNLVINVSGLLFSLLAFFG